MINGLIIEYDKSKRYYLNNQPHRVGGPAIEYNDGTKLWFINGEFHREDGPAVIDNRGNMEWWINDKKCKNQEDFVQLIKLKSFW